MHVGNVKAKIQNGKGYDIRTRDPTHSDSKRIMWSGGYRWLIRIAVGMGIAALFYYFSWWFVDRRLVSPWYLFLLILAVLYSGMQLVGNWLLYLVAEHPPPPPTYPAELSVDVFVTASGEAYSLIKRSLAAACEMRGQHNTWLLDDNSDPALAKLAKGFGAGYLSRTNQLYAKAGNLNHALTMTDGDIIIIFDVDHAPEPDFLERSLGHFANPKIGFVQVMLTFQNGGQSWVARAAMETSLDFYNPTCLGAYSIGGATLMGSNALIRRSALASIGGYQLGLAEDLATSIALHGARWESAYVPEPLAPGLAPPSFEAWFIQQLKWARGVFELLLTAYPRLFKCLTWGQRLSYAVRMTKYWIGPVIGLHLFATITVLIFGSALVRIAFHQYLLHLAPVAFLDLFIRHLSLLYWRHSSAPKTSLIHAIVLVYGTWPVYMLAWFMALIRVPLAFRQTPKSLAGRLNPIWLLPQAIAIFLLVLGGLYTLIVKDHQPSLLLMFAVGQGFLQLLLFRKWLKSEGLGTIKVPVIQGKSFDEEEAKITKAGQDWP
jgi:cellulose synthase/poly-beta-1,6-N-acetylglucosamine synthase-like glycosyltransferase